jgi:short-subunit dehydrogenase
MTSTVKYALITGASSGIGWNLSTELAKRGYSIIAVSNQKEELHKLRSELEAVYQVTVHTIDTDLAHVDAANELFNYCDRNRLEVEVLVNNAGMLVFGEVVDVEHERAAAILQLHMTTPALLSRIFGKKMKERRHGYILNVSSISAVMPYPTISYYGPSKTFLRSFTRALRTELKPFNVHVTCLLPGATATSLYNNLNVNVALALRTGVMKRPESVAHSGVNALFKKRSECIPGTMNKLVVWLFPFVPSFLIHWINLLRKPN